jgi:hypothetical protein
MDSALNKIVAQEPQAVAQLFRHYGYNAAANSRNLQNLLIVHGNKPLPFSNATDTTKPKKTLADILEMVKNGVQTVGGIINIIKGKPVDTGNAGIGLQPNQPFGATERVLGIDRKLFIALSIILLIVIAYMFFRKQ